MKIISEFYLVFSWRIIIFYGLKTSFSDVPYLLVAQMYELTNVYQRIIFVRLSFLYSSEGRTLPWRNRGLRFDQWKTHSLAYFIMKIIQSFTSKSLVKHLYVFISLFSNSFPMFFIALLLRQKVKKQLMLITRIYKKFWLQLSLMIFNRKIVSLWEKICEIKKKLW